MNSNSHSIPLFCRDDNVLSSLLLTAVLAIVMLFIHLNDNFVYGFHATGLNATGDNMTITNTVPYQNVGKPIVKNITGGVSISPNVTAPPPDVPGHFYDFNLEYVWVTETRNEAEEKDTVFANIVARVGSGTPPEQSYSIAKFISKMSERALYSLQVPLQRVFVPDSTDAVWFGYSLLNAPNLDTFSLEEYARGGSEMMYPQSHVNSVYYLEQIDDFLRPYTDHGGFMKCDGVLAGLYGLEPPNPDGKHVPYFIYRPWELYQETDNENGSFVVDDYAEGHDAPFLCGPKSEYYVTWSVTRVS